MSTQIVKQELTQAVQFNFFDPVQFDTMQRICKMFANSELVPDMYRVTEKNTIDKAISNCMIAIEVSQRIGASPLMVMQNMIIIYGKPSWSSKFLIATVNSCGRFNPMKYRITNLGKVGKINITEYEWQNGKKVAVKKTFDGSNIDNLECIAWTTPKGSNDSLESTPITIKMAIEEGWYTKAGSKWQTMEHQMLKYRAASFWTSTYAPELSMGMKTEEELHDTEFIDYEDVSDKVALEVAKNGNKTEVNFESIPVDTISQKEDPSDSKKQKVDTVKNDELSSPGF